MFRRPVSVFRKTARSSCTSASLVPTQPASHRPLNVAKAESGSSPKTTRAINGTSLERFVLMSEREERSDLTYALAEKMLNAQWFNKYAGTSLLKSPFDLAYYPMLLQELKPRTIVETGSFCGASAAWMQDIVTTHLGKNYCKVYSSDITLERVPQTLRERENLQFLQVPSAQLASVLKTRDLPRPLLFVEDAHYDFPEVLKGMHDILLPGDYLIVEDTNPTIQSVWRNGWLDKHNYLEADRKEQEVELDLLVAKRGILRKFCIEHSDLYRVDTHYTDMWGYNVGKLQNSIIKRIA